MTSLVFAEETSMHYAILFELSIKQKLSKELLMHEPILNMLTDF